MYTKLAGMTGTRIPRHTNSRIYRLETVVIPTHRPMVRADQQDKIYRTVKEKYEAILADIKECFALRQPVWSARLDRELRGAFQPAQEEGMAHQVLNAKQHAKEPRSLPSGGPR